jgi:hypothetical protein
MLHRTLPSVEGWAVSSLSSPCLLATLCVLPVPHFLSSLIRHFPTQIVQTIVGTSRSVLPRVPYLLASPIRHLPPRLPRPTHGWHISLCLFCVFFRTKSAASPPRAMAVATLVLAAQVTVVHLQAACKSDNDSTTKARNLIIQNYIAVLSEI